MTGDVAGSGFSLTSWSIPDKYTVQALFFDNRTDSYDVAFEKSHGKVQHPGILTVPGPAWQVHEKPAEMNLTNVVSLFFRGFRQRRSSWSLRQAVWPAAREYQFVSDNV